MSLVRGPFVKFQCGGCGRWIDRSISARNADQEISDLRDGPQLFCAVCPSKERTVDLADVYGYGPSAPGWKEPVR